MFNLTGEKPQIFLRPKESVNVPLRYLSLRADHTIEALAPTDPYRPFSQTAAFQANRGKNDNQLESRQIKVCSARNSYVRLQEFHSLTCAWLLHDVSVFRTVVCIRRTMADDVCNRGMTCDRGVNLAPRVTHVVTDHWKIHLTSWLNSYNKLVPRCMRRIAKKRIVILQHPLLE